MEALAPANDSKFDGLDLAAPAELAHALIVPPSRRGRRTTDPRPGARGLLGDVPLAEQIVAALDRRLTGSAVLHGQCGDDVVYFHEGAPAKVRTAEPVAPLDQVLREAGMLDESILVETYEMACNARILHGQMLLRLGLIDRATLKSVLRRQIAVKLGSLFRLPPDTGFNYHEGVNLLDEYGGPDLLHCDPVLAVLEGVRRQGAHPAVSAMLARLGSRPLCIHPLADASRLSHEEAAVVDLLKTTPMTLRQLVATRIAPQEVIRSTAYFLAVTRLLEQPGSAVHPLVGWCPPAEPSLAGLPVPAEEPAAERDPPAVRSDPPGAPAPAPSVGDGGQEDAAEAVPSSRPRPIAARREALAETRLPQPEPAPVAPLSPRRGGRAAEVASAALELERADKLVRSGNLVEAQQRVRRALEREPRMLEARALLVWIQAQERGASPELGPGQTTRLYEPQIHVLSRLLRSDPELERARLYRGKLLERSGMREEAMQDFRYLVQRNPRHLDAARELRLHEVRRRQAEEPRAGWLTRLLRRAS
ncbi:MAG: hypothetical protein HY744_06380 [Deltaproteobacteria bacterium]|nr:hypothetical protein [Deltaproteobacteria bacterium]